MNTNVTEVMVEIKIPPLLFILPHILILLSTESLLKYLGCYLGNIIKKKKNFFDIELKLNG